MVNKNQVLRRITMQNELTADELAHMLMDKRIKGEINDVIYLRHITEDVKCELAIEIKNRRPCYDIPDIRRL